MGAKRDRAFTVRLTDEEAEGIRIEAARAGMSQAEFVVQRCLGGSGHVDQRRSALRTFPEPPRPTEADREAARAAFAASAPSQRTLFDDEEIEPIEYESEPRRAALTESRTRRR